jgi:putative transposase
MARPTRFHYPGYFYHVMLRGNHGQDIFFSDKDKYDMCFLLQKGVEKYGHRIHSYCFMKNHIHLLIQVGEVSLSKIMQNLAFRYSQKINRKQKIVGHLFQGRFKAILIQDEFYFMRLLRYIHRNPIRAGIVDKFEQYKWSSHNMYQTKNMLTWLTCDYGLSKFSEIKNEAIFKYTSYVSEVELPDELDELRKNFKDSHVLGNDNFIEQIRTQRLIPKINILSLEEIIESVCRLFQIEKELVIAHGKSQNASFARAVIAMVAADAGRVSIIEISNRLNRDSSTISSLISRLYDKYNESVEKRLELLEMKEKVLQIAGFHV